MSPSINPDNTKQRRLFFNYLDANDTGETRHAQEVVKDLAEKHGWTILAAVPQTLFDGWDFWVEGQNVECELPAGFRPDVPWKRVGAA